MCVEKKDPQHEKENNKMKNYNLSFHLVLAWNENVALLQFFYSLVSREPT